VCEHIAVLLHLLAMSLPWWSKAMQCRCMNRSSTGRGVAKAAERACGHHHHT